jgi:hypothetical protein
MGALVTRLRKRGFQRGVMGDSRVWMGVWGAIAVGRLIRRVTRSKPIVEQFTLKPGQTLVITDLGKPAEQ